MDEKSLLALATTFMVMESDDTDACAFATVTVERRRQRDGTIKWAIYKDGSSVLDKKTRLWLYDRMNSSRTDDHILATRWDNLEDAMAAAFDEVSIMRATGYLGYAHLVSTRALRERFENSAYETPPKSPEDV